MKKRVLVPFIAVAAAASLVFVPVSGHAGVLEIQKQIDQIAQQEKARQKAKEEADKKVSGINGQIKQEQKGVDDLQKEIDEQSKQVMALEQQIADTNLKLAETGKQKAEAEERVASRKSLLESRVRLMYMNGSVSYLDVLLSATSFSDFIDRFQNLRTIVGKDTEILQANERDKEAITQQEAEIKTQLAQVTDMHSQKAAITATLQKNLKQKEVTIASLTKEGQKQENISEEEEAALEKLVKDKQTLYAKLAEEKRKEEAKKNGTAAAAKPVYSGGKLGWPLTINGTISSEFGYRIDPIKKVNKLHKGIDLAAPKGTPVLSADEGTVILASWVSGYGNTVVVDHNNGLVTWYGHMSAISVSEGDSVKRGGKVGEVGSTGDSTGNHLHFEVRKDGGDTPTNPRPYLGL
ncbi:murein hydrolase activator EnvC [Paenibacillus sp. YN15]|uniref:murein hydrolase activator EnvC family protein n=1 Tax=Paenibacillus sp. YN15 TaxID=1742774 RepID=UPI000DCED32C|nr:M23 family metallopeptidase [Paenibacillus sp. YN15]RAV03080.1 peptidase M23 [Paenibacillus sp. YN15]